MTAAGLTFAEFMLGAARLFPDVAAVEGIDLTDLTPRELLLVVAGEKAGIRAVCEAYLAAISEPADEPDLAAPPCVGAA